MSRSAGRTLPDQASGHEKDREARRRRGPIVDAKWGRSDQPHLRPDLGESVQFQDVLVVKPDAAA